MHEPIQTHGYVFLKMAHFLEHHKVAISLTMLAVLVFIVSLTQTSLTFFHTLTPSIQAHSAGLAIPLTYIEDPRYIHEREERAHYITAHLEQFKIQTQADRVYVMSYRYVRSKLGIVVFISKTLEVGEAAIMAPAEAYTGLSRMNWLLMIRYNFQTVNSFTVPVPFPACYGQELYDRDGRAIGYLGVDYVQENPSISGKAPELLQQTAPLIQAGFLQPLDELKTFEGTEQ